MVQSEVIFYIIKLVLGGIAAFLAILLWSRTRDSAWMALVAGYGGIVYEMLVKIGIVGSMGVSVAGIPLAALLFAVIPSLFYILGFTLMVIRTR